MKDDFLVNTKTAKERSKIANYESDESEDEKIEKKVIVPDSVSSQILDDDVP